MLRYSVLPQGLRVYQDSTGVLISVSEDRVGALRHFYLVFVCEFACVNVCVCVCVCGCGEARPSPTVLFS